MLKKKIYIIVNHGGPAWWTHQTVLELSCSRKNTDKHCIALHYWCNCLIFKIKASLLSICRIYSVELNLSRWKPCQCKKNLLLFCQCYEKFLFSFFIAVNVFFFNCLHCDHDQGRWRARLTVSQFYELLVQKIIKGFKMYLKTISQIQLFYTILKKDTTIVTTIINAGKREKVW